MQKRVITAIGLAFGFLSSHVLAAQSIEFSKEIVPRVINEQAIDSSFFESTQQVDLKEGHNQLLITLNQLVAEDGRRSKYSSTPMIIDFKAGTSAITLSYKPFRTIEDARSFEKQPQFILVDDQGNAIKHNAQLLHIGGFQSFPDYQAAVIKHNGSAATATAAAAAAAAATKAKTSSAELQVDQVSTQIDIIKSDFENMTAEEQKEFMMWAMGAMKK
ncbi:DUF2057 family protein [Vibrio tapetis subsp. quintayensis]|uniref:DUF2057 family protein n=1 Tax=Vibrio tapetis TaxID=52443 RepID=UPI0025B56E89|nr:DUF2057 family protein [Vibrio tapetis]MDN3681273.1 DUF2057 family protein [Vibrio tapetis subsp. quintayensis]